VTARFTLSVRLKPGREEDLMRAYDALRRRVAAAEGLVGHQLCQSLDDPDRWMITSEWESVEASSAWDRSPEHDRLTLPLRDCWQSAEAAKYVVRSGSSQKGD
jgi:heme-degrading monooxygenase HmoA